MRRRALHQVRFFQNKRAPSSGTFMTNESRHPACCAPGALAPCAPVRNQRDHTDGSSIHTEDSVILRRGHRHKPAHPARLSVWFERGARPTTYAAQDSAGPLGRLSVWSERGARPTKLCLEGKKPVSHGEPRIGNKANHTALRTARPSPAPCVKNT